jgi:hypothetical protein
MPVSVEGLNTARLSQGPLATNLGNKGNRMIFSVPVVDQSGTPLMPTYLRRAEGWVRTRKATPFWSRGVWCVRLNVEPSAKHLDPVAVGVDPGSKREAFTIKSKARTHLNVLAHAVDWVKDAVEIRGNMRGGRRFRKAPCREPRFDNRKRKGMPPSTKARWQWKLRIAKWLTRMFPVSGFVVEDVRARTKGRRKWDVNFSPLEVGKSWFYGELKKLAPVITRQGWETKVLRDRLGLRKTHSKLAEKFSAHNVDSFALAWDMVGGDGKPDNESLLVLVPFRFHRRQLHAFQPSKNGVRRPYGGTKSLGFKRGSLIRHPKHGLCYVGGSSKGMLSLHSLTDGRRVCQNAKPGDVSFRGFGSFRFYGKTGAANSSAA